MARSKAGWCDACFSEVYPARKVACGVCGKTVRTHGKAESPMHRKCKAAWKAGEVEVLDTSNIEDEEPDQFDDE